MLDALDAAHSFELPPTLVENEFNGIWAQLMQSMEQSKKTFADEGKTEDEVEAEFADSMYGDFKKAVADAVVEYLAPVRERYPAIREDEGEIERILADGAAKAREIASATLADVRAAMGVGVPRG